jgi:hypothetical protein
MMYDPKKLQCYTMASRMRGYADALEDHPQHEALVDMLMKAAVLLEDTWLEYLDQREEK